MSARVFPLPAADDDPRFTFGLIYDVAKVLESAGYPPVKSGADFVDLRQALFRFLYATPVLDEDQPTSQPAAPARGHVPTIATWSACSPCSGGVR